MQSNAYIDLHSDTITMLHLRNESLDNNKRMVTISAMQNGGTMIQCFSAFVPTGYYPKFVRDPLSWKRFLTIANKKDVLLKKHCDYLYPVLSAKDIENHLATEKIGVLFTIEDAGVIGTDLQKIETAYEKGVRIATLTWNHENHLAYPNSANANIMQLGLKPLGFAAVEEMNRLGIIIDVSHLSDGGFYDVAKTSKKPFIATHSNSRTLTNHPRNLTDDMIKIIAEHGGVIGLNFAPNFLAENNEQKVSRIPDMVKHVMHIRNVGGSSVLAIGSDFDGIHGNLEIDTPEKMPLLFNALSKAGMTTSELEDMYRNNILRVFHENWE